MMGLVNGKEGLEERRPGGQAPLSNEEAHHYKY
jgi:hypothetical protein